MDKKTQMNNKKLLVSFLAIASILFVAGIVSASELTDDIAIEVDGIEVGAFGSANPVLIAGETVDVKVTFTADVSDVGVEDKDVTVTVTIDTGKDKVEATTSSFRVAAGGTYTRTVSLEVPYELKDDLADFATIEVEIEGKDHESEASFTLRVERDQYETTVKSLGVPQSIEAGDNVPVSFVIKNTGYYDLDDLYVTVSIPELGLRSSAYLDELFAQDGERSYETTFCNTPLDCVLKTTVEGDEDDEDTVSGRIYLEIPYDVLAGVYALEIEVQNDDLVSSSARQIVIGNDFETTVFVSGSDLWIVNPTDKVIGYRVVPEAPASVSENVVFIAPHSSDALKVTSNAEGAYSYDVNVFNMNGDLVKTINFTGEADEDTSVANPIVILTVILAIIFLVLLVVLIVLIGKKPEKSEEFGESYY